MKLPTFYLSTLLLLCVFAGAVLGLWVTRNAWHQERFLEEKDFATGLARALEDDSHTGRYDLPEMDELFTSRAYTADKTECAEADKDGKTIRILTRDKGGDFTVLKSKLDNTHKVIWLQFSKDRMRLGAVCEDGIAVFRRSRGYGWQGFLTLPLTWVAVGALLALIAVILRRIFTRRVPAPEPRTSVSG